MKINYLFFFVLLMACNAASTNQDSPNAKTHQSPEETPPASEIPDFSGHWKWNEKQEGRHIFELVLEQKDSIINGYICAIAETADGQRIDCAYGDGYDKYNLAGTIKENVITANITGAFSKQNGKVMIIHNKDQLRWTILESPGKDYMEDYFFPNEAILIPDDRSTLRNIPYRKDYAWKTTNKTDFSGKWILTDFLDSTVLQKKVMPFIFYPQNRYTHALTLLDFSSLPEGKLHVFSDVEDDYIPVVQIDASTLLFEYNTYTYQLERRPEAGLLKLTVFQKNVKNALKAFDYRQAPEQIAGLDGNVLDLHFNEILTGQYRIVQGKGVGNEVQFGPEKKLSGLEDFDLYEIHWKVEAGTPEVDAVRLFDSKNEEGRYFHFRFEGNTLFLYHLKKTADPESGFYEYQIAEKIFQLKKIK